MSFPQKSIWISNPVYIHILHIILFLIWKGEDEEEGGGGSNEEEEEDVMESAGENEEEDQVNHSCYK